MTKEEQTTKENEELNEKTAQETSNAEQNSDSDKIEKEEKGKETENKEESLEDQLASANQKIVELSDKYLRLFAEFDNYKKRNLKEKAELIKNGGERTLESFLPVADDMERALEAMEKAEDTKARIEGIKLIHEKLIQVFGKNGVSAMEVKDQKFDTDLHEAIAMIPAAAEEQKGKIVDCIQTGYMLNDKVLRHAKVVVAQ